MTPEQQAEEIVSAFKLTLPIGLDIIIEEEGIVPREIDGNFDARIEYHPGDSTDEDLYLLFHAPVSARNPIGRQRFSIAHELGHFYLERHRKELHGGKLWTHKSSPSAVHTSMEREANAFAASLLMPFQQVRRRFHCHGLDLEEICDLATLCQTTLRATASRYTQVTDEPCGVIVTHRSKVKWKCFSPEARQRGYGWEVVSIAPQFSGVRQILDNPSHKIVKKTLRTGAWLTGDRKSLSAHEESIGLNGDWVLTMLFWDFP